MPKYEDLTWAQVKLLAAIVRINLDRIAHPTTPMNVVAENFNLSSVWALHRRGIVNFDQDSNEVTLFDEEVLLAERCLRKVQEDEEAEAVSAGGREYIVKLSNAQRHRLFEFVQRPNGALSLGPRLSLEAVENGGLLVRVRPYSYEEAHPRD